jgi:hypothetical protein
VIPRLGQTVKAVELVSSGWDAAPGTTLETQRTHYENVISTSKINFLGALVLIIGMIMIIDGSLMVLLAWRQAPQSKASTVSPTTSSSA